MTYLSSFADYAQKLITGSIFKFRLISFIGSSLLLNKFLYKKHE
ncbi:hypothetical protein AC062_1500 [Pasteurellaceae bacterium NI1060]|nr:hypothetical protein AC062_1500 [Pasteurellaceae bacterium NI1060]